MNRFTLIIIFTFISVCQINAQESVFRNFITRSGNKLMDGENEFRFISFNIPNLNYVEDEFGMDKSFPFRLPDEFEIRDALETIKQLGGNVVRVYTIPVRRKTDPDSLPTYVLAPGKFDEESFNAMDLMFALANKIGIRIIIGLVNNWQWMGGRPQYADFREKMENDFWTDRQLIDDVKETMKFVINRTNTITGEKYKDDKSLLCWETGNELTCPQSWTSEIVRYIKSLDQNHLVMDGFNAINSRPVRESSVSDPNIDIVTSHHYESNPDDLLHDINKILSVVDNKKVYIIGEMGFLGTPVIERAMDSIIANHAIAGALLWSIRSHRREGGFYWHSEPLGAGIYKAYHWPGFTSGEEYDETNLLNVMRKKGFEIQNLPVPQVVRPGAPVLIDCNDAAKISWRGSAGASSYDVLQSEKRTGPWKITGFNISDADVQYAPLFNDESAVTGKEYYYCIIAKNSGGNSDTSNIIGPVKVEHLTYIDNLRTTNRLYSYSGGTILKTDNDRDFFENMYRLEGEDGSEVVYFRPGNIIGASVYSFAKSGKSSLTFQVSEDGSNFTDIPAQIYNPVKDIPNDYNYWRPGIYSVNNITGEVNFLKIKFSGVSQISRVEIYYLSR